MREEILNLINKNSRLTAAEISKVLNAKENVVAEEINKMEEVNGCLSRRHH